MKITGKNGLGRILEIFLQICFYIGIVILIALPFILNQLGFRIGASMYVIYPNGIVLLAITKMFIKLFKSLKENNPFCDENVKILGKTSIISLIGSALWIIDLLYQIILVKSQDIIFNCTLGFLSILYFGVAIALYILSELFKEATKYKKENELTI